MSEPSMQQLIEDAARMVLDTDNNGTPPTVFAVEAALTALVTEAVRRTMVRVGYEQTPGIILEVLAAVMGTPPATEGGQDK